MPILNAGASASVSLPAGQFIQVTGGAGVAQVLNMPGASPIALDGDVKIGPFAEARTVSLNATAKLIYSASDGVIASLPSTLQVLANGARAREFPLEQYGEVPAALVYNTASMSAGSAVLSVAGYAFGDSDVGKTVGVFGPGVVSADYTVVANDGVLVGTILSVSGGNATLSVSATNTVSNAPCVFGFPIDAALSAAIQACRDAYAVDSVAGVVTIPAGRFIAVAPQPISSGVSFAGASRDSTFVYVVKIVDDATNALTAPWIRRAQGYASVGRYDAVNLSDFTVVGTFYAATGVYGADMKMIHMAYTSNSTVQRIATIDNPSTALGYDESVNCLIANNIILNPGRLGKITSSTGSAGGSGIGVAVGSVSDLSMVIRNNFIKGKWTSSGGTGRSGINIEAASGTLTPTTYYGGILIEGNIIEGFYNGIVDSGAIGTIIKGNTVRRCTNGIKAGSNGITVGAVGRDVLIQGNRVTDGFEQGSYYGIGIAVTTASATRDTEGRTMVEGNIVTSIGGGYGIQVFGTSTYPLRHTIVRNNAIRDCDLSGMRVFGNHFSLVIAGNSISSNGRRKTAGNRAPILVDAAVVWTDGRLDGNLYSDYQSTPSQDATHTIQSGAVLTNVTVVA